MLGRREVLASVLAASGAAGCAVTGGEAQTAPAPLVPIARPSEGPVRVAFLMDAGVTMIDFAGPWEAFQDVNVNGQGCELYTVAPTRAPVITSGGMEVVPKYALADAPQPHVIVIPAQMGGRAPYPTNEAKVSWLRAAAPGADVVLSVCTGAFMLARTGLLDGLSASTHHDFADDFERAYPNIRVIRGRRFVDNGKFVTSAALTTGVDAALHIVARYFGMDEAHRVARYMDHQGDGWITGVRA